MNYFFFLDNPFENLEPSVEIFNRPSNLKLCKDKLIDCDVYAFYSDGNKWYNEKIDKIKKEKSKIIRKSDLPSKFIDQNTFLGMIPENEKFLLENFNYMNANPEWRGNIRISGLKTSTSFQGEYPGFFLDKKLSLVSCSPMVQSNFNNYFYLINLSNKPEFISFEVDIYNEKKELLSSIPCFTNKINCIKLSDYINNFSSKMYVMSSKERGGIPIYFSVNDDHTCMSLEHTHPPIEYIYWGKREEFQKNKKSFWFE